MTSSKPIISLKPCILIISHWGEKGLWLQYMNLGEQGGYKHQSITGTEAKARSIE